MREGCVQDVLKTSIVTPALKVSPPMRLEEDLRPITLTSLLAKVLEGFTLEHLLNQVADSLDLKEFSVSGRSTTHALVYMLHVILEALDSRNCFVRIFFADFSKGFDLVDHNALVSELELLNVNNVIVRWLCSFLSNRPQYVKIRNVLSNVVISNGGIPQGTKTAPLLFAILVNGLVSSWPNRLKYVDDTSF